MEDTVAQIVNFQPGPNIKFDTLHPVVVKGGTLEALVEYLFSPKSDEEFITTFLMTYRSFCSEGELMDEFNKFLGKNEQNPAAKNKVTVVVFVWLRMRTMAYDEFNDFQWFKRVNEFVSKLPRAKDLKELLTADIPAYPKPPDVTEASNLSSLFQSCKAEMLAEQICLVDHYLLSAISPKEFENQNWSKVSEQQNKAPNISRLTQRFNTFSSWVIYYILSSKSVKERNARFEKCSEVMEKLLEYNNYLSARAVYAALVSVPVFNLRKGGFVNVKEKLDSKLNQLNSLFADKNAAPYRASVKVCLEGHTPCIPFLGTHLQDLTFIADGNKDKLSNGMINFKKRVLWNNTVHAILTMQVYKYNFSRNVDLFSQLFFISGFQDSQLDAMVKSIKEDTQVALEDSTPTLSGVHISTHSAITRSKDLVLLKLEEQAVISGSKRVEVWKRWIESLQNDIKDISSESTSAFLSYAEVFLQSKAMPLLVSNVLKDFPDGNELLTFKTLLSLVFSTKEGHLLDPLLSFLKLCSRFRDNLDTSMKARICLVVTSFTVHHQLYDQENMKLPNPVPQNVDVSHVEIIIQEMTKVFTTLEYLSSRGKSLYFPISSHSIFNTVQKKPF